MEAALVFVWGHGCCYGVGHFGGGGGDGGDGGVDENANYVYYARELPSDFSAAERLRPTYYMNRDLLMYFGNSQPPIYLQSFLKVCSYFENAKINETEPNKNLLLLVYFGNSQSSIYLRTSLKVYIVEDFENIKK